MATRVFSTKNLVTAAVFGIMCFIGTYIWPLFLIYLATLIGHYFVTVHHVASGEPGLPTPSDVSDHWSDIIGRSVRGIACAMLGLVPLVLYVQYVDRTPRVTAILAMLTIGQLYMPAVVLSVALTNTYWAAISPVTWVRVIARAPAGYIRFVGIWIASATVALGLFRTWMIYGDSFVGGAILGAVWTLYWFAHAVLVGEYIRSNAEKLGWE